jgi:hypothetical protein
LEIELGTGRASCRIITGRFHVPANPANPNPDKELGGIGRGIRRQLTHQ